MREPRLFVAVGGVGKVLAAPIPVRNERTDCDGIEKAGVWIVPPPYLNAALLMTAAAPLWIDTLPHMLGVSVGVVGSFRTLMAGTMIVDCWVRGSKKDVVARSSWTVVSSTWASPVPSATKFGFGCPLA